MDLPTYETAAASSSSAVITPQGLPSHFTRTIQDLRTQIIANASCFKPKYNNDRAATDHLEIVVAKAPATMSIADEKEAVRAGAPQNVAIPFSQGSMAGKHYAVLVKRSSSDREVRIVIKGEPRDSVEQALEWMLDRTEMAIHEHILRYGRNEKDGCCVM
ncbi:hypothetical protein LTR78_006707 [Recurvomyces mirabilis]|uniref:Uncharacterized protein n=1 Tax=Recurvomyces mirabilis TaxID=574656 RepID=A0AAE0WKP8_9PEZI|nr:hypothetical protein LTR78_006707 [Recurvomyces mirabilis]KAK5151404.1 hypothetical protein LTS14_009247 [Recurvomyces mirabilis]